MPNRFDDTCGSQHRDSHAGTWDVAEASSGMAAEPTAVRWGGGAPTDPAVFRPYGPTRVDAGGPFVDHFRRPLLHW